MEEEKREEDFFQKILKKLKFQLVAIFPAEMSEWPPRSYIERILMLHIGQK